MDSRAVSLPASGSGRCVEGGWRNDGLFAITSYAGSWQDAHIPAVAREATDPYYTLLKKYIAAKAPNIQEVYDDIPYRVARYVDTGLDSHRMYYYRIRPVDKDGVKGDYSEEFSAKTRLMIP